MNRAALLIGEVAGVVILAIGALVVFLLPYALVTAVVVVTLRWMGVL